MVDSIQATSTVLLPDYQTTRGSQDPLPLNGPEQTARDNDAARADVKDASSSDFESYLNSRAILHQDEERKSAEFDAAEQIANSSVYKPPGSTQPL